MNPENYKENPISGWIKIHRTILRHWIFKDAVKFRAWIIILCEVNHKPKKVVLGNKLLNCKRGESLNSLETWSNLFGKDWNKSKVRRFFNLLESDNMIRLKNETKTTRLTVCNYDTYQDVRNADETQVKRKRNASETQTTPNKNVKKEKNVKNDKNIPEFSVFLEHAKTKKADIDAAQLRKKYDAWIYNDWKDGNGKKIKSWKLKLNNTLPYIAESKNQGTKKVNGKYQVI